MFDPAFGGSRLGVCLFPSGLASVALILKQKGGESGMTESPIRSAEGGEGHAAAAVGRLVTPPFQKG